MKYIDVNWLHSNAAEPIRLVSEIGADGYEKRKLEFWANGTVGYAQVHPLKLRVPLASPGTALGTVPVASLEINNEPEFQCALITAEQFETLWVIHGPQASPHLAGLTIRHAIPADAAAIAHLHVEVWRETYRDLAPPEAYAALDEARRLASWQDMLGGFEGPIVIVGGGRLQRLRIL
jgi:hypothetical protein